MKRNRKLLGVRVLAAVALLATTPASAKLPELDAVYFGALKHNDTEDLTPSANGDIIVSAVLNGVTIAQHQVVADQSQYELKVPMDDGGNPRIPGTARAGEQIRIFLRSVSLDLEFEARESPITISSVKGDIEPQPLSVDENLVFSSALLVAFQSWAEEFQPTADVTSSDGDGDGDGRTNFDEFLAGTDPLSPVNRFAITDVFFHDIISSVQFGPVAQSRNYTLFGSHNLLVWQPLSETRPLSAGPTAWLHYIDGGANYRYFRVGIELE